MSYIVYMMMVLQRVYNEVFYIVYMMMVLQRIYNEVSYIVYMMMALNLYTMRCLTLCI